MRRLALFGLLIASTCWAQEPNPQPPPSPATAPTASPRPAIIIPAGTRIPMALTSPITAKARPGDAVRAVTGFPVTVGTQVAIPAGTYAEGVIDKLNKGGRSGASLQMHFTRLVYANGYSVAVEGANPQARVFIPPSNSPEPPASAAVTEGSSALVPQSPPTLPSVQPPASHTGAMVGLAIGGAAAAIAIAVLGHQHHGSGGNLFDTGWQFEMVLESPLSVDAENVAAAAALPRGQ